MAIFSILFGASVMLLIEKYRQSGQWPLVKHVVRNGWLLVFGLLHGVFLWAGDILMVYAILAFVLYIFHSLRPRWQFAVGLIFFLAPSLYSAAVQTELTDLDEASQETIAQTWQPSEDKIKADIELFRSENTLAQIQRLTDADYPVNDGQDIIDAWVLLDVFSRAFGMMLIGMALFSWGVITADRNAEFYRKLLKTGLAAGLPLALLGLGLNIHYSWDWRYAMFAGRIPNNLATPFLAMAYIALIMLWSKSELMPEFQKMLAAVGRMALTNYIGQTIIAIAIFYGIGLGLYGQLNRGMLLLVVVMIWIFQLTFSSWWMKNYHYGPLEWLWRSLAQFKIQPLRKRLA